MNSGGCPPASGEDPNRVGVNTFSIPVSRACSPGHLGASQTCCRLNFGAWFGTHTVPLRSIKPGALGRLNPQTRRGGRRGGPSQRGRRPSGGEKISPPNHGRTLPRQPTPLDAGQEPKTPGRRAASSYMCARPESIGRSRSRSLSESTRQITPPTRNGHAPPSNESRKNSQSVNPYTVLTW